MDSTESILGSRENWSKFVYTHWKDALEELKQRREDPALTAYVEKLIPQGVPEPLKGKDAMVLFRHLATSDYDTIRFVISADALEELRPTILEYHQDQFNDRNEAKYFLGKLSFFKGMDSKANAIFENKTILNFNENNTKPIGEVRTYWGQTLPELHHELFTRKFPHLDDRLFDISDWLKSAGSKAKEYYKPFFALFLQNGILFENFQLDAKEFSFTKEVIYPALSSLYEESGYRPLIVTLEPTEIESDQFWRSHPHEQKAVIDSYLADVKK